MVAGGTSGTGNGPAEARALAELAARDPGAAAAHLAAHADALASAPPAVLRRALSAICRAVVATPDAVDAGALSTLVARFGQLVGADDATELAAALRPRLGDEALSAAIDGALSRAPANAGWLRAAAELAAARADGPRAHALLTRLGRADASLSTVQYAYAARKTLPATDAPPVRMAFLSSFTIDPLVPYVDLEARALHLEPQAYIAPFNTWERELLGQGSGLERFSPQVVFLSVAADDLVPELATGASSAELAELGAAAVDRLLGAAQRFTTWSNAVLVMHSLHSAFPDPLGAAAGRDGPSRAEVLAALNARLAAGLRALPRAYSCDLQDVLVRRARGAADNPKMRHLAGMRLGDDTLAEVAHAYACYLAPLMGRTRKCVILDLDNTLWGGIVGEDGPHGIRLGHTSPGSEYREFQQYLLTLTQRGILLALNSKNNAADALEVIRDHEYMVLREEAFSAVRINWESKANNLLSIAQELSLGLDSFIFVDDNEKERELVRQALPQVLTPDLPRDPALYRQALERLPELQTLAVTDEDRTRARQYVERRQREDLRVQAQTVDDYLASLGIVVETATASERTLPRVHQLFQRTNQFNLTGRRYEAGVLADRAAAPDWRIYTTHVRDRFGDHGLVASALVRVDSSAWTIENFVMSCRVIGYGVESALLARVGADARAARAGALHGEFVTTPKNAPARDFYEKHAFARAAIDDGVERWERPLSSSPPEPPPWITLQDTNGS